MAAMKPPPSTWSSRAPIKITLIHGTSTKTSITPRLPSMEILIVVQLLKQRVLTSRLLSFDCVLNRENKTWTLCGATQPTCTLTNTRECFLRPFEKKKLRNWDFKNREKIRPELLLQNRYSIRAQRNQSTR